MTFFEYLILFFAEYLGWLIGLSLILLTHLNERLKRGYILIETLAAGGVSRFVFTEIIRNFYHKQRPFEVLDINPLFEHAPGGSFPSGNAAFFFALAATIFIYDKKWGAVFFIAAVLMGVARVMAGVHWPIDIVGGAIVGIISSLIVNFLVNKIKLTGRIAKS